MTDRLLDGTLVLDLAGEPAVMAARILGDLGAEVVRVVPPGGDDLPPGRAEAWSAGKAVIELAPDDPQLADLLAAADVVIDTPGWPDTLQLDPSAAPGAVWVSVTPFGLDGPRAGWRGGDLGVMAASGNMHATGDPDRPPVRCTEPTAYAHGGPEIAFAALTALASGRPQRADVSLQEVVLTANMCAPARLARTGERFQRRGANIGRTREIWPCKDGWVSFGLRGGKARVPSLETLTRLCVEASVATPALTERDWSTFSHTEASDEELAALEGPVAAFFAGRTMQELYDIACETNLMLAPVNSPREIYASAQLAAREFFREDGLPRSFVTVRSPAGGPGVARVEPRPAASLPELGLFGRAIDRQSGQESGGGGGGRRGAWAGTRIVEFGSGAAGPIVTRYFAEHGATVVRVESRSRPDFLRVYALGPGNPHGLEGSVMFDGLNVGKFGITLNLKVPEAIDMARRLMAWADGVCENFAPRAMKGFGLDYDSVSADQPNLVMLRSCLNGQTGPHKDYPGFGGQGAALSGYNHLTGWPDREPVGPFGTITDSLAPRFGAAALAAGLLYRRRTGRGVHLDLSQVEAAVWSLAPWLLAFHDDGTIGQRQGNRSDRAVPHGAFPCEGTDRWVAIACWSDDEWARLAPLVGLHDSGLATLDGRHARVDEIEAAVARWTQGQTREEVAGALQALGIEAVPVQDFADLLDDPQLLHRGHFVTLDHSVMGPGPYERNGLRLSDAPAGYDRTSPTLGEHNFMILHDLLGLSEREIHALQRSGALDT